MAEVRHSGTPYRREGGSSLPEGWIATPLEAINGYKSSSMQPKNYSNTVFSLFSVPIFPEGKPETLNADEIGSSKQFVETDDILVCKINPRINRVWKVPARGNFDQIASSEWIVVRQKDLNSQYLTWYFRSDGFRTPLCADVTGVGGSLTRAQPKKVAKFEIPLPPLAEQKIIAEKLDTLLAQVDTTKARLERIPDIIKHFRQSVLAAAVSGKLTGVQVNSIGQIKDCANVVSGLAFKKSEYSNDGSRLLQIANVGYGSTKWDSPNYIPLELAESCLEYSMQAGDIVLALNRPITNDTLKVAWIRDEDLPATLYQRVARLRCNESLIDPMYLFLAMQSKEFLEVVSKNLKGSDQPYLNTSDLSSFSIAAPEKKEQIEIVRRVEELFAFADTIEQKAAAALERVNNLTQSILAKAFRGELTAEWRAANPELISGDNSAEALLAKIQAEREALALEKKAAKKTRKKKASA